MKGTIRPISLARKLVIDAMHASVPLIAAKRTMKLDRLVTARASQAARPSWSTMIAKAFCIVARDEPWLRTYYLKWPWPHFYELPMSVAMIVVVRDDFDKDAPILIKINAANELSLADVEGYVQRAKHAPLDEVPSFKRILRVTRMPLPLRRLLWAISLNIGRQRANNFGAVWITTLGRTRSEVVVARGPGPNLITYGAVRPDGAMKLLIQWDHRIYDGMLAARALQRPEDVLNTDIADELLANAAFNPPSA